MLSEVLLGPYETATPVKTAPCHDITSNRTHADIHRTPVLAEEDKCRDILVRYCAHIPRNYQYRDGVQVIFLILRDHLGDGRLGIAGGVLYELIELDCQYTHDAGASFQRWKFDHMNRHANLELPHVPHLTTVVSAIQPSSALRLWRASHPHRYPVRLSDHAQAIHQHPLGPDCIKDCEAWAIEHTMYVSAPDVGTTAFRGLGSKECSLSLRTRIGATQKPSLEQATSDQGFMRCQELPVAPRATSRDKMSFPRRSGCRIRFLFGRSVSKIPDVHQNISAPSSNNRSRRWLTEYLGLEHAIDLLNGKRSIPLPRGRTVPHPSFARKHKILPDESRLSASMARNLMPTAESLAVDTMVKAASRDQLGQSYHRFQGPFTPQMAFVGGRDLDLNSLPSSHCQPTGTIDNGATAASSLGLRRRNVGNRRRLQDHDEGQLGTRAGHDWFGLDRYSALQYTEIGVRANGNGVRSRQQCRVENLDQEQRGNDRQTYNWFGL